MKNFALIGAAGYIAPRHMKAIKDTNNNLIAALDRFDSVGIMDSYFPNADFFVEPERFDRHLEKLRHDKGVKLDYVGICTPNYLHDSHIRMALRRGADAICEKPLVLNPWNIDIEISGLRPGEKLYEELLANDENTLPTYHDKIMIAKIADFNKKEVNIKINEICCASHDVNNLEIVSLLKNVVPEYISNNSVYEKLDK